MIQEIEFAPDSPLEGDGFEPSVPVAKKSVFVAEGELRGWKGGRPQRGVSFTGYRWFESISLQQRVTCEPDFRHASLANHMLGLESWPGLRDQTSATPSLLAVGAARG